MTTTLGKYEVLFPLSMPGGPQISLAIQKGFGGFRKLVILREMLPELKGNEAAHRAFMHAVKTVAGFHHSNIAEVYDLEAAEGHLLLATEFIPGATLEEVGAAFRVSKLRAPLGLVMMAVRDAALALQYAHSYTGPLGDAEPVVHGAITARTVQLTFEGPTKVLEFGLPRAKAGPVTPGGDLEALGALVPGILAENPADIALTSRNDLTSEIRNALNRLIAADPKQRFATAGEFAKALETAAGPVIWKPEQSAALIQKMFGERRDEIRELLSQLAKPETSTALMPLSKIFSEGRAPGDHDPPTMPPHGIRLESSEGTNPQARLPTMDPPPDDEGTYEPTVIKRSGENPMPLSQAIDEELEGEPQTVVQRSGPHAAVRPAPEVPFDEPPPDPPMLGDEPPLDTDLRPATAPLPRRSQENPMPPRRSSGLLKFTLVIVLVGSGALLAKWRLDPAWVRARSPQLAHLLEGLAIIPGFPGPEAPLNEQEVLQVLQDAGTPAPPSPAVSPKPPPPAPDAGRRASRP